MSASGRAKSPKKGWHSKNLTDFVMMLERNQDHFCNSAMVQASPEGWSSGGSENEQFGFDGPDSTSKVSHEYMAYNYIIYMIYHDFCPQTSRSSVFAELVQAEKSSLCILRSNVSWDTDAVWAENGRHEQLWAAMSSYEQLFPSSLPMNYESDFGDSFELWVSSSDWADPMDGISVRP